MKTLYGFKIANALAGVLVGGMLCVSSASAAVAPGMIDISNMPLFLPGQIAPLNLLVMGRDHKLYYEAYNDHSDLNGGGLDASRVTSVRLKMSIVRLVRL